MRLSPFASVIIALILLGGTSAFGQTQTNSPFQNTAPPTPVGSGARAMGTGGAFISIADDATAATWNPGGLVQLLTPEVSLVVTNEKRRVSGNDTSFNEINYLSVVYPFAIGNVNFVSSMNYQRLYDHNYQEEFDLLKASPPEHIGEFVVPDPTGFVFLRRTISDTTHSVGNKDIQGSIGALSPSLAVQLTPKLSVGFTYNFWDQGFIGPRYSYQYSSDDEVMVTTGEEQFWQDTTGDCLCGRLDGPGLVVCDDPISNSMLANPECLDTMLAGSTAETSISQQVSVYERQKMEFEAQNFNVGLLFKASPRWTLGAVYRSEYIADIEREFYLESQTVGVLALVVERKKYHEQLRFPASYGIGAAFRYSDAFTVTADVSRTEWDRFTLMPEHGRDISPVSRLPMSRAEVDPTMSYRAGAEYLVIGPRFVVPVRAGFFYDPEPGYERPDEYYGFSLGSGLVYNRVAVDVAYWYRWGDNVIQSVEMIQDPYTLARDIEVKRGHINRQMVMVSAILHLQ